MLLDPVYMTSLQRQEAGPWLPGLEEKCGFTAELQERSFGDDGSVLKLVVLIVAQLNGLTKNH